MTHRAQSYLLAMWEGGGTVPPQLGVGRRLAAEGHRVHVLADPTIQESAEAAGFGFTPWSRAPHRTTLDPAEDLFRDWEVSNPMTMLRNACDRLIAGPAEAFAAETAAAVDAVRPDAVLADGLLLGSMIGARGAGVPVGALVPNIWMLPTPGLTPVGPGLRPARTAVGRARDAIIRGVATRVFDRGLPQVNRARAAHGLPPLRHLWDQVLECERVFVLTSSSFDLAAELVPDHVRYVGPILDDPDWAEPLDHAWRDASLPLVLVGLSSTYQDQVPVLRRIVAALGRLPVRAVVTVGQMLDPADVPPPSPDVVVVTSASHRALLEEASVVVTHCGHGTTMKALASGTPMVCMPMGRDQNDTARRVERVGAGLRISPGAEPQEIAAAIRAVLGDGDIQRAATEMRATLAAELASVDLVAEILDLTRTIQPTRP